MKNEKKSVKGYELAQVIGYGGFGVVYNAYQPVVDREVAVKVIHDQYVNDPEFVRRFEIEAQTIARLEHPHIVPLYDFWRDTAGAFLVMRLLPGGSIRSRMANGYWKLTQVAKVLNQISDALSLAHHIGIVHRDLKPENILFDTLENAYLTDFGIAIDTRSTDKLSLDNLNYGSPAYIPPEQLREKIVIPQGDIYSLGIILYEMLAGKIPFSGENTRELIYQTFVQRVPAISGIRSDIPRGIDHVIWRATSKEVERRYQSITELRDEFLTVIQSPKEFSTSLPLSRVGLTGGVESTRNLSTADLPSETTEDFDFGTRELDLKDGTRELDEDWTTRNLVDEAGLHSYNLPPDDGTRDLSFASPYSTVWVEDATREVVIQNPYKGLEAFDEADAGYFFGRQGQVEQLISQFRTGLDNRSRFVAIVGASGSGKSSLVKAGLIPALRAGGVKGSDRWFYVTFTPGGDPIAKTVEALQRVAIHPPEDMENRLRTDVDALHDLAGKILPENATLLMFIDQFEEVYTQWEDNELRDFWLDSLTVLISDPNAPVKVITTLRADFYNRPLMHDTFGELLRQCTHVLRPMGGEELEQAIILPSERTGIELELGLSAKIITDLQGRTNVLPLLQYAMREMFERRSGSTLTLRTYQEIGGVSGALASRAEGIFSTLDEIQQAVTRNLFLQLIVVGESGATRQRVNLSELLSVEKFEKEQIRNVIERFVKSRLLAIDSDAITRLPTVEITHEALIDAWERFLNWIGESRDELRVKQRLQIAVNEWLANGTDDSFLAVGARLGDFEMLLDRGNLNLDKNENDYIKASIRQRKRNQRRVQIVIITLVSLTIAALSLAGFAFDRQRRAEEERIRADRQARTARSRELAALAMNNMDQTDLSLLLSVEAFGYADTFEARNSLLTGLMWHPFLSGYLSGLDAPVRSVQYSPDDKYIVAGGQNAELIVWDAATRTELYAPLTGHTDQVNGIAVSTDGFIASASSDGTVRLWEIETGESTGDPMEHDGEVWDVAFHPDESLLASVDSSGKLYLWDLQTGELIDNPVVLDNVEFYTIEFSPDGEWIAIGGNDNIVRLVSLAGEEDPLILGQHDNWVFAMAFSRDGSLLATSGSDGTIMMWDVASQEMAYRVQTVHTGWIRSLAFNANGQILGAASDDGTITLYNVQTGQTISNPLTTHNDAVWGIDFASQGRAFVTGGADSLVVMWNLDVPFAIMNDVLVTDANLEVAAFDEVNDRLVVGTDDGSVLFFDTADHTLIATESAHVGPVTGIAFNADYSLMATSSADRTIKVWDVPNRTVINQLTNVHTDIVNGVVFHPDRPELFSIGDDNQVVRWSLTDYAPTESLPLDSEGGLVSIAINQSGTSLAVGTRDSVIYVLTVDDTTMNIADTINEHGGAVLTVVFSDDGRNIISGGRDRTLRVWNANTFEPVGQPMMGHSDWVMSVITDTPDRLMMSSSRDGTIAIWDLNTLNILGFALRGHTDWVNDLVMDPVSGELISVGEDGRIIFWSADPAAWREVACWISQRDLAEDEWRQYFSGEVFHQTCK